MRRVAWFSPLLPSTSGIAAYSAEVLPVLEGPDLQIDAFSETNAHDFVWTHRRRAYDLTVFHIGNARCHDFMWAYLFRYPGLVVLHDAQLHQARALFLTHRWKPRRTDYLAEFRANHPDAPADIGELVAAGLGGSLYQHWPLTRLVIARARRVVVHNVQLAEDLRRQHPQAPIDVIEMGVAAVPGVTRSSRAHLLERHGMPGDAVVLAAFGGITPEKRIPQLIRALSAIRDRHPSLHLMLVGDAAAHYDVVSDARTWAVDDRVHLTGFVTDEELPNYLLASDVCACLRWPTNRETSASWLRCLAAGRPTIVTELSHLGHVPTLDPRGWRPQCVSADPPPPVAVSIDLLDEEHSLQLALERLADDSALRRRIGDAGRDWWRTHHRLESMADAYRRVLARAAETPMRAVALPPHLLDDGTDRVRQLSEELGMTDALRLLL